jgi:tetratricopeptide (TPR) repeat protein
MTCDRFATLLALGLLLSVGSPPARAETMGLGPDARESIEEWAGRLGLTVEGIALATDHAAIDIGQCAIVLAHETGSRCSGLHMDGGGARVCLTDLDCLPWSNFQQAVATAGAVFPPWRPVEVVHPRAAPAADGAAAVPASFEAALQAVQEALIILDEDRARVIFNALLDRSDLTRAQLLQFVPALGRLGLGGEALSRLGSERWVQGDMNLTHIVRFALSMGPAVAVAVADALLGERGACEAVAIGHAFALAGDHASAAKLGLVLRRKDVKCFEAFELEVAAAYRAGQRQAAVDAFYEARGRFPKAERLPVLALTALRATGQWRAAKFLLDQRLESGRATPDDLVQLVDVVLQPALSAETKIAWTTRLDGAPKDPLAAFYVGVFAHQDKDYTRSYSLLERAAKGLPGKTGRLHTLQALNAFSLGDPEASKAELRRSLELDSGDYQGHWAAAEVLRDMDLFAARRSLEIAIALLPHRALAEAQMKRQHAALLACDGAATCEGPWRYTSARAP